MGKTSDEIKKGLVEAIEETAWVVEGGDAHDLQDACDMAHASMADALALIQQLERQKNEMWSNNLSMQDALTRQERVRSNLQERISQLEVQVPRWIPVEERLPGKGMFVVVYYGHFIGNLMDVYMWDGECWRSSSGYLEDAENITHWMPLPEPLEGT